MSDTPELLLHIGAGKTGSTSIQFTLRHNAKALIAQDCRYAGLMLEQLTQEGQFDWSVNRAPQKYFRTKEPERVDDEVYTFMRDKLEQLGRKGYRQVIWSNEAFLTRHGRIIHIIKRLADDGVAVRPVCYVRRHDKWARSVYVQNAIKFKPYRGRIKSFDEWAPDSITGYSESLARWARLFPNIETYNFDAIDDVAAHFFELAGLEPVPTIRANVAPSNAVLAAWAVFNNKFAGQVMPTEFLDTGRRLGIMPNEDRSCLPIEDLLPSVEQLQKFQDSQADDLEYVNTLLTERGEPALEFHQPEDKPRKASDWEMNRLLLQMIYALQEQVVELEEKLDRVSAEENE
ncbi:hypothetical protein [Parasphingopyxis sp.]|uniref:hypothetical protein n=1 Tax=Parasphingopyxis sp. TaxID=1920299 RepID=UPI00260C2216|nr:hypothetical protein [Parasphingopyxis sp.]